MPKQQKRPTGGPTSNRGKRPRKASGGSESEIVDPPKFDFPNRRSLSAPHDQRDEDHSDRKLFQLMEVQLNKSDGPSLTKSVYLFGVTRSGRSVCCCVEGFQMYFHCSIGPSMLRAYSDKGQTEEDMCAHYCRSLNQAVHKRLQGSKQQLLDKTYVRSVVMDNKNSFFGYRPNRSVAKFLKVVLASPDLLKVVSNVVEEGLLSVSESVEVKDWPTGGKFPSLQLFGSNLTPYHRFMVDSGIVGGGWVRVANERVTADHLPTTCTCNMTVHLRDISPLVVDEALEGSNVDSTTVAPIRILSIDALYGEDTESEQSSERYLCPILQICCSLKNLHGPLQASNDHDGNYNVVFCHDPSVATFAVEATTGGEVYTFPSEELMLVAFQEYLIQTDPDVVTGYDVTTKIFPHLLERGKALKLASFGHFGRFPSEKTNLRSKLAYSASYLRNHQRIATSNVHETNIISMSGRVVIDMLRWIEKAHKLRFYSLGEASVQFLGETKEYLSPKTILRCANGTEETRARLMVYGLKHSRLSLRLMDALMTLYEVLELARTTGLTLVDIVTKEQMIRTFVGLHREAVQRGLVIPHVKGGTGDQQIEVGPELIFEGGQFVQHPVVVCDFNSLYPSLIMSHNLCYSTFVAPGDVHLLHTNEVETSPGEGGGCFVRSHVQRGILPDMLMRLLEARKQVKNLLKVHSQDSIQYAVLDARQKAIKVCANALYGFTGSTLSPLPLLPIAVNTLMYGSRLLLQAKSLIEANDASAQVIYGDTDSLMVALPGKSVVEAIEWGKTVESRLSAHLQTVEGLPDVVFGYEKVYHRFILVSPKRYCGLASELDPEVTSMDTKGLENVRRDICTLVRESVACVLSKVLEGDVDGAVDSVRTTLVNLRSNQVDLSKLLITKSLRLGVSEQDYKAKQPHVALVEKLQKRHPNYTPLVGDRITYVVTQTSAKDPLFKKVEEPFYVMTNKLPLDVDYYISHLLKLPIERILGLVTNTDSLFDNRVVKADAAASASPRKGTLGAFFKPRPKCVRCRKQDVKPEDRGLCRGCEGNRETVVAELQEKESESSKRLTAMDEQCLKCAANSETGQAYTSFLCRSIECPTTFERFMVNEQVSHTRSQLEKLLDW